MEADLPSQLSKPTVISAFDDPDVIQKSEESEVKASPFDFKEKLEY